MTSGQQLLTGFVTLLVVVNPVGKLPIFLVATMGLDTARRTRIAPASPAA